MMYNKFTLQTLNEAGAEFKSLCFAFRAKLEKKWHTFIIKSAITG